VFSSLIDRFLNHTFVPRIRYLGFTLEGRRVPWLRRRTCPLASSNKIGTHIHHQHFPCTCCESRSCSPPSSWCPFVWLDEEEGMAIEQTEQENPSWCLHNRHSGHPVHELAWCVHSDLDGQSEILRQTIRQTSSWNQTNPWWIKQSNSRTRKEHTTNTVLMDCPSRAHGRSILHVETKT
jgi:hypothetical protein